MPTAITKNDLPKINGIAQADYTTKPPVTKKDEDEDVFETLSFKLAMQELTHPPLDILFGDGKGSSSQNNMATLISQAEQLTAIKQMGRDIKELNESNKLSQALEAFRHVGKEASYDDSKRTLSEDDKSVTFNYELKYGKLADENSRATCSIEILDDKGTVVFQTKQSGSKGANKFVWDGKTKEGKKVEPGEYSIKVNASFDKGANFGGVEATTLISGVIEAVEIIDGKAKLRINGELIDLEKISKLSEAKGSSLAKPSVHEVMNYLNKQVEIDSSRIQVRDGKGEIFYNNTVEKPGKLRVDIFGENSEFIKTIYANEKVVQGEGQFTFNAAQEGIFDGNYTTAIFVQDMKNNDRYTALDNTKSVIHVDSVDVVNAQVRSGGRNYNVRNIVNIAAESNVHSLASQFLGKSISFVNDAFEYDGSAQNFYIDVPTLPAGRKMQPAELKIFKGNEIVAVRKVPIQEPEPIPTYAQLSAPSQTIIDNAVISELRLPGKNSYNDLNNNQKLTFNELIAQKFRAGELYKVGQDLSNPAIKEKNMGQATLIWDGQLDAGGRANADEHYRYEISTSNSALDDTDVKTLPVVAVNRAIVIGNIIENNTLFLELNSGIIIPANNVRDIAS